MLLLSALAFAGSLAPAAAQSVKGGLEIAAVITSDREWLAVPRCEGGAECRAVRLEIYQGLQADFRITRNLGVWIQGDRLIEQNLAANYEGTGFAVSAGAKGGVDFKSGLGIDGWVTLGYRRSRDPSPTEGAAGRDSALRYQGDVGVDLRLGNADEGFLGWVGVEATVADLEETLVLDGTLPLSLRPAIPASGELGFLLLSEPLSGPWANRGRLGAGITGKLGFRSGITGWVMIAL